MSRNNTSNFRPCFCWLITQPNNNDKPQVAGKYQERDRQSLVMYYTLCTYDKLCMKIITISTEVHFAASEDFLCPEIMIFIIVS